MLNRDLELACDEKVIKTFGEDAKTAYALSLIEMAECRAGFTPLYTSFSRNATEERILSIMRFKKASAFSLILAFMLVAGASAVFAESAASTVLRLYGTISANGVSYSFDLDERGIITVKDAGGRAVSTTAVDGSGRAVLRDGDGKVIKNLQLDIPPYNPGDKKFFRISGLNQLPQKDGPAGGDIVPPGEDGLPKYLAEVDGKGAVTVRDGEGGIIGTGNADSKGEAVLTDDKGAVIGTAFVNGGDVIKLLINIGNTVGKKAIFFKK